ncbi:hypothetical protein BC834DRAFT_973123 [Gloeopeniophorella convolvens]|nr:hypothetical protein BC834DRAFT_973123 [Gloeopeniophorella convolvens]
MHRTEGLREIDATPPPPPTSSGPPLAAIPSFMIPPQLVGTEADGIAVPSLEPVVLSVPLLSDPQQDVPTSPAILAHASHVVLLGNPQCPPPAPEDAIPAPGNLTAAHLSLASPSHHADQAEAAPESQEHPEALPLGDDDEAVSQSTGAVTTERMALVTGAQTFRRLPVRDQWQSPV